MTEHHPVIAVGLLTERDLAVLGQGFRRLYRLNGTHDFDTLLAAIDDADRAYAAGVGVPHGERIDGAAGDRD